MNYLIPLAYLNEATFQSENIDEKKQKANLEEAQAELRSVLGTEFYDQIETQYVAETLAGENETLYESYIKQYLAWQAFFYSLGFSQADSTPTGVRQFEDENSTILEDVKMFSFEKNVNRRATRYKFDLINFLRESQTNNSSAYPLWTDKCEDHFNFGITSISRDAKADEIISVNKVTLNNE